MNDQPIKFIEGPPPTRSESHKGGPSIEGVRTGAIRADLRATPGVWAEVAREPKDNVRAAYGLTHTLKAGRLGAGIEAVTRRDGSTVVVYARFVA